MGRILVLVDHENFPKDVLKLVQNGLKDGRDNLYLGVVLHELLSYDAKGNQAKVFSPELEPWLSEDEQFFSVLSESFKNTLGNEGIKAQRCYGECLNPLLMVDESAYADLMVMSARYLESFLHDKGRRCEFSQMLKNIQCPLLVIPADFEHIHEVFLVQDRGSKLVSTIKSFEGVLSKNLKNAEVSVLASMPNTEEEIDNEKRLMDFLRQHFRNVGLQIDYNGQLEKELLKHVSSSSFPLVVIDHFSDYVFEELMLPLLQGCAGGRVSFFIGNPLHRYY
jgi:hypothetical protein